MLDQRLSALGGRRVLVVEDDYVIASDLAHMLRSLGVHVIGPAASVRDALALMESNGSLDGAVLDVNLANERVFPVAESLRARGVPFVFATGYAAWILPPEFADAPRCEKPVDPQALARLLSSR